MAITRLNSLAIPAGTVEPADISYPLTNFSSTGIDDNADALAITIDSNENVGIGTASPTNYSDYATLTLNDTQGGVLDLEKGGTVTGELWTYRDTNDIALAAVHSSGSIRIMTGGFTEHMRIDSSGKVGIGTATATYDLTVVGASNFSTIGTNDAALRLRADGARTMQFYTNSAEAMRINSSGYVGIGDSAPPVKLSVETSTSGNWAAVITNTHATNGFGLKVRAGDNSDVDSFRVADVDNAILYQIDGNGCVKVDPLGNTVGLSSLSIANNAMTIGSTTGFNMAFDSNEIQARNNGAANDLIFQKNGGSVGIGTSTPTANCKLHVADADVQIELEATGTTPNNSGFINFDGTNLQLSTNRNMKDGSFSDSAKSNASILLMGPSGNSSIRFYTATANNTTATLRARIDGDGLKFNADSATANALDDYEEGTWTPSLSVGSATFTSPKYTKIGRLVYLEVLITAFSDRTTSSAIVVNGLPYTTSSNSRAAGNTLSRYINSGGDQVVAWVGTSRNYMTFYTVNQGSDYQNVQHNQLNSASSNFHVSVVYET